MWFYFHKINLWYHAEFCPFVEIIAFLAKSSLLLAYLLFISITVEEQLLQAHCFSSEMAKGEMAIPLVVFLYRLLWFQLLFGLSCY